MKTPGEPMMHAVEMINVTKRFGDVFAVKDVSLVVPTGATYGILGQNGAGKTTSMRMIAGIFGPDEGRLSVLGAARRRAAGGRGGGLRIGQKKRGSKKRCARSRS